jgi:transcriptional regulator with XRE-family HTH domain
VTKLVTNMSSERFAMKLKKLRESKGLTQAELAERAGISREYLARLELGQHDPHLSRLRKLAQALRVKVSELVD